MSIKKHIPNSITSLNLLCGVVGIVFAFRGRIDLAFPLMILGAAFDFLDGLAARALDAYSDMGKELDSLCDLVTFGVLPAMMMHSLMRSFALGDSVWAWVPLLLPVCTALRLAKFNVDERQHMTFLGLACPMSALLCASVCYYVSFTPASPLATVCCFELSIPALTLVLCVLLLCEVPMFSFKFSKQEPKALGWKRISFIVEVLLIIALVAIIGKNWSLVVVLSTLLYILKNLIYRLFRV